MGKAKSSKVFRHPKGGGATHVPETIWSQYELQHGDEIEWWPVGRYKADFADDDNIIILLIRRKK